MSSVWVVALFVASGVFLHAAATHLIAGLQRPPDRAHLLFAGLCVAAVGMGLTLAFVYTAPTPQQYVSALRWNLAFVLIFCATYCWFIVALTELRTTTWPMISTTVLAVLLLLNVFEPHGLAFVDRAAVASLRLPWDAHAEQPSGQNNLLFWSAAAVLGLTIPFALYALYGAWRRRPNCSNLLMLLSTALLALSASEGMLVRADLLHLPHLGLFGLLLVVIVMSVVLKHRSRRIEEALRLAAAAVSPPGSGRIFEQLVLKLSEIFGADYAVVAALDEHDPQYLRTHAWCVRGSIEAGFTWPLRGTPGENVVGQTTRAWLTHVREKFPRDALLNRLDAQAFIGAPLFDSHGAPLGLIAVLHSQPLELIKRAREVLEIFAARAGAEVQRERAESRMRRMAYEDSLTGLPNRARLHEKLSEAFQRSKETGIPGALLLVDIDHFKTINDALGHDVGDEVLRAAARQMMTCAGPDAFVAHLGGDEFVVVLERMGSNVESARSLAQRLLERLAAPISVGDRAFAIGASVGIATFPGTADSVHDVLRHADMALYRSKNMGRGVTQVYEPDLHADVTFSLQLREGMRRALERDELQLCYQPQVDGSGRVTGAEVLLRWKHPELGQVPPSLLIATAEESGLIHAIGGWVLERACAQLTEWDRTGVHIGHLSVNVSPWQFARPQFVEDVRGILSRHAIKPGRLTLELTETALLYDVDEAVEKLNALRMLGVRVAMDDFGTGYSSLAYLRVLPLDQLKIDKLFIAELSSSVEHPLAESMIAIGKHMKLEVVAEGVENELQRERLIALSCDRFQGFLYSRPLPVADFVRWLRQLPGGS